MASVTTRPNGHRWVLFTAPDAKRHTIRLGRVTRPQADQVRQRVEHLIAAKLLNHSYDLETARWLASIGPNIYDRLATAGLVPSREVRTVGQLVAWYQKQLAQDGVRPATLRNIGVVGGNLVAHFHERPLNLITEDDAGKFRDWLQARGGRKGKPLARTTVSRRCRRAREIFAPAQRRGWIEVNPFARMWHWSEVNLARNVYIERHEIEAVLAELPDLALRLVVALARFAGLRSPSEPLELRWSDIDWAAGTMTVTSVKTARYDEKQFRTVPIFQDLRTHLEAFYATLSPGAADQILTAYLGKPWTTLSRRLEAACRRAGVAMWTKPFVNMRASCEHDWLGEYPINVVANWMGHSPQVALLHYNRVSKELTAREVAKSLPCAASLGREVKGEVPQASKSDAHGQNRTPVDSRLSTAVHRRPTQLPR